MLGRAVLAVVCALLVAAAGAATATAADPTPVGSFDGSGTPDGSFDNTRIAVDEASGDVYVIDAAHDAVDRFTSTGTYVSQIRGSDTTNTSFGFDATSADEIAVDNTGGARQGWVYVNSRNAGIVFAFDASGVEQCEAPGPNSSTFGVAVDPGGNPWVSDRFNPDIAQLRFDDCLPTGTTITTTNALEPSSMAFDAAGGVYVVSRLGGRLDLYPSGGPAQTIGSGTAFDVATSFRRSDVFAVVDEGRPTQLLKQWDENGALVSALPAATGSTSYLGVTVDGVRNRVYTSDHGLGTIQIYSVDPPAQQVPTITPLSASNITTTSATLNGRVNPNGADVTDCHFEYGTTIAYGLQAPCVPAAPISGSSDVAVSAAVTGLTPGATYHYRLVAANSGGPANGADVFFRTLAARTCATDPSLCPPPVRTCATDPSLCPPPPVRTCATDPSLCPPPPPPPATCATNAALCRATLALAGGTASVSRGSASVRVNCTGDTGGTCRGSLTLKARVRTTVRRGRRTVTRTRTITVGTASYSVAVGSSASLRVTLSSAAKSALKKGALTATADGVSGSVKLSKTRAARRRAARRRK
jgi:hypothetical protein